MMGLNLQTFTILTITMLFSLSQEAYSGVVKRKIIKVSQANTQIRETQVMRISMPQKAPEKKFLEKTTLGYYHQFLGPTAGGTQGVTYNVFQEGINSPGSGFAPYQSFHVISLRQEINADWAVGGTLSMVNGYTDEVQNTDNKGQTFSNNGETQFFNARAFVSLPKLRFNSGTLFTTLSYEHPTSTISQSDDMRWGWVAAQSFALNLPSVRWSAGFMGQIYRIYYENNVKAPPFPGGTSTPLQTMIVSLGPYASYRFSDKWMLSSMMTFDWDQRGEQTESTQFNNNLSDRGRVTLTYFPQQIKYLQSVGLFTQALLKYTPDTTAFGADFSVRF